HSPGWFASARNRPGEGAGRHGKPTAEPPRSAPVLRCGRNLPIGILPRAYPGSGPEGGPNVGVKFLSEEWAQAVQDALNSNDAFKNAAGSQNAKIQQVVNTEEGEKKYWFKLEGGQATLGMGDSPEPVDATITQDYATAEAL